MKLGIFAVYMLKANAGPLLQCHLERIARHTTVPYTIYGAPVRLQPEFREVLQRDPRVKLIDVPPTQLEGSREHAYHLDALVQAALDDGVTHLCALHVDSFPVRDRWAEELVSHIDGPSIGAAIFRAENGDRVLPLPAGFLFCREFQERCQPRFFAPRELEASAPYQQFMREFSAETDSGIGYAYQIHAHGLKWHRLLRSNKHDDHYLLAGIYGDMFFHLGAAARTRRRFRGDAIGLDLALVEREKHLAEAAARNTTAFDEIFDRLISDPDRYIERLRTGSDRARGIIAGDDR